MQLSSPTTVPEHVIIHILSLQPKKMYKPINSFSFRAIPCIIHPILALHYSSPHNGFQEKTTIPIQVQDSGRQKY